MRTELLFWVLIFRTTFLTAQTADVTQGCVPLKVNFTPPGSHATHYWDFDGAGSSTLQNPSPTFVTPGVYDVIFRETSGGPQIGSTIQITVFADPTLTITAPGGCVPFTSNISAVITKDPAITISSYQWFFGDGSLTTTSATSTSHLYSAQGTYTISVQTSTNFPTCNNTYNFTNTLEALQGPSASFNTNPSNLFTCNNNLNNVSFTNTSTGSKPLSYSWNLGNGNTSTNLNPPNQNYSGPGTFTASLLVSYTGYTGCSATASKVISLGSPNAVLNISDDTVCTGDVITFSTPTPGAYNWTFGSGASIASSTSAAPTVSYSTPGLKTVSLRVTFGTCSSTVNATVLVDQVTASLNANPTLLCDAPRNITYSANNISNATYFWTLSKIGFPTIYDSTTTPNYTQSYKSIFDSVYYSRNYNVSPPFGEYIGATLLIRSNISGCTATASRTDTMWLPNARFAVDKYHGCAPLTVTFRDSSYYFKSLTNWRWLYDNGGASTSNSTDASVSHTYSTPGVYYPRLIVTSSNGCVDTSYAVKIEVGASLTGQVDFTATPSTICVGQSVILSPNIAPAVASNIDAYHYYGEGSRISHCYNQSSVNWTFDDTVGTLPVELQVEYNGCLTTVTKNNLITVNGARAKMYYQAPCATPLTYNFESRTINGGAATLTWDFGDASGTSAASSIAHNYAAAGDYTVTLQAQANGCTHTETRTVYARSLNAAFTTPNNGKLCINRDYNFDASASSGVHADCYTGYTWEFPTVANRRPSNRPDDSPPFSFPTGGIHTVKLVVKDVNGCIDSVKQSFKVYDMNVNATISDNNICIAPSGTVVDFTNTTTTDTTIAQISWAFGDGSPNANTNFVSHNYTAAGSGAFTINLVVEDVLGCFETRNFTINRYTPSSVISILNPTSNTPDAALCVGDSALISASPFSLDGSSLTYSWNYGNSTSGNTQSAIVKYNTDNTFTVDLTITEVPTGCQNTTSATISVQDYPTAYITTNPLGPDICGVQVIVSDSSVSPHPLSHQWDFGTTPPQTSTAASYAPTYVDGSYTITHSVTTSNGCADVAPPKTVRMNQPLGTFNINKNLICKGDSVLFTLNGDTADVFRFEWSFGDGTDTVGVSPIYHTYAFSPNNNIFPAALILHAIQPPGCTFESVKNVTIHRVVSDFDRITEATNGDTIMCMNELPYYFTNTSEGVTNGTDIFRWHFGDSSAVSSAYSPTHLYDTSGIYTVSLYAKNVALGCEDSTSKEIVLFNNPVVVATSDTSCFDQNAGNGIVNLQVTNVHPSSSYLWTPSTNLSSTTDTVTAATLTAPRTYIVIETDSNGCTHRDTIEAIVILPLDLNNFDTTIVVGDFVTMPAAKPDYYTFTWTPTEGLSCLDCSNPRVQPLEDIVYNLTVTDDKNCFNDSYVFDIKVYPETFIKFPTLFTPNGDGANDIIYVEGWGIKELLEFKIFNRWGQLIYESTNVDEGWDGTFKGAVQNTDVYAVKIRVLTWRDEEKAYEGYFNLVR